MNIGVDFDGVILDSERELKFYADYYSYFILNKEKKRKNHVSPELCFDWTDEEIDDFYDTYYDEASNKAHIISGAEAILKRLRDDGHKIFLITLRGLYRESEKDVVYSTLRKMNFNFDGIIWAESNKLKKCRELEIDVMIDDNEINVDKLKGSEIKVLYYRDANIKKIKGNNIVEVQSWADIYREIKNM